LKILLSSAQLQQLQQLAKKSLPNESCAFLLGNSSDSRGEEIKVKEIMPMQNADRSRVSFTMSPDETLRAYRLAEEKGLQVAGIFHSHPSQPSPSSTDARFMEVNPVVWVIYSTTANRFGAWIFEERIKEVEMVATTA
jgi:proteasome lid subunit RPN8/RPN11